MSARPKSRRFEAVVEAGQAQRGRQLDQRADVGPHHRAGAATAAPSQIFTGPVLGELAQPRLGQAGEVDAAGRAEHGQVPVVFALFLSRTDRRAGDVAQQQRGQTLQVVAEPFRIDVAQAPGLLGPCFSSQPIQPGRPGFAALPGAQLQTTEQLDNHQSRQRSRVRDTGHGDAVLAAAPLGEVRADTREVIIGGVLGPITRPDVVIAGLYRGDDLVVVGRTVPLDPRQAAELGKLLQPAKPGHPWPDQISSQRWGGKDAKKPLTKVEPLVVAEVTADAALQAGQ
jgi:hypothetical protein